MRSKLVTKGHLKLAFASCALVILGFGTGGAYAASDAVSEAKAAVQAGYSGSFEPPPSTGPAAVKGKTIWYISCGQAYVACAQEANGFIDAGKRLGWTVNLQDGKATPDVAANLIRLAIAAKADGIAIAAFDCPSIKSALLQAKEAKIPTVAIQSIDCSDPFFGAGEDLFTATINLLGSRNYGDYYRAMGKARAEYIIAKTDGHAKIVSINETGQHGQQLNTEGFTKAIAQCPDCTVKATNFTFGQVPNPANQIWKSALLKNPDATVLEYGIDALMSLGLQEAVKQSGRPGLLVGGGEGFPANFDLIRSGVQTFSVAVPFTWLGWGLADTMNRVLAGEDPRSLPSEGTGFQYIDKDHNLPGPGKTFEPNVDFKSAYEKVWSGQTAAK